MEENSVKRNQIRRAFALITASLLSVGAVAMFSGCTTDKPEVTITYTFNGKDYAVDYTLSRKSAPQTVQHFIELADAKYYDGLVIHDYSSAYMYSGGYRYDETTKTINEVDYFSEITAKNIKLTQSVFTEKNGEYIGMNTLYGEFSKNGISVQGSRYYHKEGALVMYYTDKGSECNERVVTRRSGSGEYQQNSEYKYNCATSLFYTFTGTQNSERDSLYCVFCMASNYSEQMKGKNGLLTAISDYMDALADEEDFTESKSVLINANDPYQSIRDEKIKASYNVPVEPIYVKSVVVNKY
jgi:cyclophilin family peptidyl-prolyl cis-trans isomerase